MTLKKFIISTAAVIIQDRKILMAQRADTDEHFPGCWEFPGGKIAENESPDECVIRELREELAITISVDKELTFSHGEYDDRRILLLVYKCSIQSGTPQSVECKDVAWKTVDEVDKLSIPTSDEPVRELVQTLLTEN